MILSKSTNVSGIRIVIKTLLVLIALILFSFPAAAQEETAHVKKDNTQPLTKIDDNISDTGVLWRGFRHVWSYNHRVNRLGSWVEMENCDSDFCTYSVGHSGASGSGQDNASFRDAYTEISAQGVGFYSGKETNIRIKGTEATPDNGHPGTDEMISGTADIEIDLPSNMRNKDNHAVLLNGFDLTSKGLAAKFIRFNLDVKSVSVSGGKLNAKIDYDVLLDCDSMECKGNVKLKGKWRGGKKIQDVNYRLDIHYLAIAGNDEYLNIVRGNALQNDYTWKKCKNEIAGKREDKWDKGFLGFKDGDSIPGGDHMLCEETKGAELDYRNYYKKDRLSGKQGFTVGVVGIDKMYLDTHNKEAHFVQYDNIMGGNYDASSGNYDVRALPFFKEWSSRPGQYPAAGTSYGHKGGAQVKTEPVLIQIKNGCKRSFVQGGGLNWPGGGKDAISNRAVEEKRNLQFSFGEHWSGYGGRGNRCQHSSKGQVDYTSYSKYNPAFSVAHVDGGQTVWKEFQSYKQSRQHLIAERTAEDPTQLRARLSDRYYDSNRSNTTTTDGDHLSLLVSQDQQSGQIPLSQANSPFIICYAGLFDVYDSSYSAEWPEFTVTPNHSHAEVFLLNKTTGNAEWLGTSTKNQNSIKKMIDSPGTYTLETVFEGANQSATTAMTLFRVAQGANVQKLVEWDLSGDYEKKGITVYGDPSDEEPTRQFLYDWSSEEGRTLRVMTDGSFWSSGKDKTRSVSAPLRVHAFEENFSAEADGNGSVKATRVEADGQKLEGTDRLPQSANPQHAEYNLAIFACYNIIGTKLNPSGNYTCDSNSQIGTRKVVEHTIKVGDAYGPEQPRVSVQGQTREQGSGLGYVDYETSDKKLTFQWPKPGDQGASKLGIDPVGLDEYTIEISAEGGRTFNISERNFGRQRSDTRANGNQRMMDVSFSRDGYHEFKIWAIDKAGNSSSVEHVKLCVNEPDCETPGEKAVETEAAKEATQNAIASQMIKNWLDRFMTALEAGEDPEDLMPAGPDIGFDYGDPVPCKVCMSSLTGKSNWMPIGRRVNVHLTQGGRTMHTFHVLIQERQIVRLGGSALENSTMETTIGFEKMRAIAGSDRPLVLMQKVVTNQRPVSSSKPTAVEQSSIGQNAGSTTLTLIPRGGLSMPGVSSLGDISGEVGATLEGGQSVLTWGGSIAFGPRDRYANVRLTGLYRSGTITTTLQNDELTTSEVDESFTAFTADLVLRPIPRLLVQPYAIGGFGFRKITHGNSDVLQMDNSWKPAAQLGAGLDIPLGNQGFVLGVEVSDYISNFSGEGDLRHDAFVFGMIGIPLL